jgi:hypothetical protein
MTSKPKPKPKAPAAPVLATLYADGTPQFEPEFAGLNDLTRANVCSSFIHELQQTFDASMRRWIAALSTRVRKKRSNQ